MDDLNSEGYSIKSRSSEDLELGIARIGGVVGVAAEGEMAMEDILPGAKEIVEDSASEDSESSDSSWLIWRYCNNLFWKLSWLF